MLCEKCQARTATVHMVSINNNHREEHHLCEVCAAQNSQFKMVPEFSLQKIFPNFFTADEKRATVPGRCPNCGWNYQNLQEGSYLGCSQCYEHFGPVLRPLLERAHGSVLHKGKIPLKISPSPKPPKSRIESLKLKLDKLVKEEKFEEAALIRDQIRSLEEKKAGEAHEG